MAPKFILSLPEWLKQQTINCLIHEGLAGHRSRIEIVTMGGTAIGARRAELEYLECRDVLQAATEGIGGEDDLEVKHFSHSGTVLRFDLISHRAPGEARVGDYVLGGIHVEHSLTGAFATRIESALFRLACSNGLVHRQCAGGSRQTNRTRRLPSESLSARRRQLDQIRRLAGEAMELVNERMGNLRLLADERVDFERMAGTLLQRSRLSPERLMGRLRSAYEAEGSDGTAFGVLNAFTRVATHDTEVPASTRSALSRMGGLLAFGHDRLCRRCWGLIAGSN